MTMSTVSQHNQTLEENLELGDIVAFPRGLYDHFGLFVGGGNVVHKAGEDDGTGGLCRESAPLFSSCGREFDKACVKEEKLSVVAKNRKAQKRNKDHKRNPIGNGQEIVDRAKGEVGKTGYNVFTANCEHFVTSIRYGEPWSDQVNALTEASIGAVGGVGAAVTAVTAGILWKHHQNKRRERSQDTEINEELFSVLMSSTVNDA